MATRSLWGRFTFDMFSSFVYRHDLRIGQTVVAVCLLLARTVCLCGPWTADLQCRRRRYGEFRNESALLVQGEQCNKFWAKLCLRGQGRTTKYSSISDTLFFISNLAISFRFNFAIDTLEAFNHATESRKASIGSSRYRTLLAVRVFIARLRRAAWLCGRKQDRVFGARPVSPPWIRRVFTVNTPGPYSHANSLPRKAPRFSRIWNRSRLVPVRSALPRAKAARSSSDAGERDASPWANEKKLLSST